jgi:hypothetical protein
MTISIEDKLGVIIQPEECERIVDIWRNVRFTHSSICTICDNDDIFSESDNQDLKLRYNII